MQVSVEQGTTRSPAGMPSPKHGTPLAHVQRLTFTSPFSSSYSRFSTSSSSSAPSCCCYSSPCPSFCCSRCSLSSFRSTSSCLVSPAMSTSSFCSTGPSPFPSHILGLSRLPSVDQRGKRRKTRGNRNPVQTANRRLGHQRWLSNGVTRSSFGG